MKGIPAGDKITADDEKRLGGDSAGDKIPDSRLKIIWVEIQLVTK